MYSGVYCPLYLHWRNVYANLLPILKLSCLWCFLCCISFAVWKLFSLMWSHLSVLSLNCWAIVILFGKLLFPVFSIFIHAAISQFQSYMKIFNSLWINTRETGIMFQSSAGGYPVFTAWFVEEAIFSIRHVLGSIVKNQMAVAACVCMGYMFCLMVFMPVFVHVPCFFIIMLL
jgi:hypothetical protein